MIRTELEINKILKYKEDFLEAYVKYLKAENFKYYEALLALCEDYKLSSDDMSYVVKSYLTTDILIAIESEVGPQVLKKREEITEEEVIFIKPVEEVLF